MALVKFFVISILASCIVSASNRLPGDPALIAAFALSLVSLGYMVVENLRKGGHWNDDHDEPQ